MFTSEYDLDNTDIAMYAEMWSSMKSYIPTKDRLDAASHFIAFLIDNGVCDVDTNIDELVGVCNTLDRAITMYKREHSHEEDDELEEFDDEF